MPCITRNGPVLLGEMTERPPEDAQIDAGSILHVLNMELTRRSSTIDPCSDLLLTSNWTSWPVAVGQAIGGRSGHAAPFPAAVQP